MKKRKRRNLEAGQMGNGIFCLPDAEMRQATGSSSQARSQV
jgi:hypothetical protein